MGKKEYPDRGDETWNSEHCRFLVESEDLRSQPVELEDSELASSSKSTAPFWTWDLRFWIKIRPLVSTMGIIQNHLSHKINNRAIPYSLIVKPTNEIRGDNPKSKI